MSIWVKQGTWHHMTPTQRTEPLISLKKPSSRNGGLIVIYHDRTREKKTPIYNLNKHKESLSLKMIHPELRCADFLEPMDTRLSIPPNEPWRWHLRGNAGWIFWGVRHDVNACQG